MTNETDMVPAPGSHPIDLWNRMEPRSLINLVPPAVADSLLAASQEREDLFQLDERTLWRNLRSDNKEPTPTDNRIRLSFWNEYERVQAHGGKINISQVYAGICTREYFYGRYLKNTQKVAWLACPPANYLVIAEEALIFGIDRLRDILEIEPISESGKFDSRLAEIQLKIVALLDNRVKGAVVQKSVNVNVAAGDKAVANAVKADTMEEIERRLKDLERMDRRAQNLNAAETDKAIEAEFTATDS